MRRYTIRGININSSRSRNAKRNIIAVTISNGGEIVLTFLARTAVLYILGSEYVGLSGLFNSILQVLNLADFGFAGAVVYGMYKPMADGNEESVCSYIHYLRRVYVIIGLIILIAGVAVMPLLPHIINGNPPDGVNVYVVYLLFLLNTVASYLFFAEYSSVLTAAQRLDVVKVTHLIVHIIMYVVQIGIVIVTKNYYLYIGISIASTLIINIAKKMMCKRLFPVYYPYGSLTKEAKKDMNLRVGALFFSNLGNVARQSVGNIVISSVIGLAAVGVFDNYYFIMSGVYVVLNFLTQAMMAGVGNSIATESREKNLADLAKFDLIYMWISSVCTAVMFILFQPVMRFWAGQDLLFDDFQMTLFCVWFYMWNMYGIINLYFIGNGFWHKLNWGYVAEASVMVVGDIAGAVLFGVTGVLIVTVATITFCRIIPTIIITFRYYFREGAKQFWRDELKIGLITVLACVIGKSLYSILPQIGIITLVGVALACLMIVSVAFILIFRNTTRYESAMKFIKDQFR